MKQTKNILIIDTSSNKEVEVGLIKDKKKYLHKSPVDRKNQMVLPLIEKLLKEHKISLNNIDEITVNPGPGSFTGLRVGVAIANTLGFLLKIPINGKEVGEIVEPEYS
ncbi:MAG TPA: tRNA (adenosine(37)-N6)-threonylcarbamoyltransferase complex dimerization subunit type 1 TsaB [Candidatus Limnocylindrales bacterium]|nr:tRNA (adenosine(37)-N6)-threonylcarbamoyltransferase complex dimerization subunit type 1 TsaB [Candidatus Limnocylindrales bacterium]